MQYLLLYFGSLLAVYQPSPIPTFPDDQYVRYSWKSFMSLPAVQAPLDLAQPDYQVLDAAVFFVSNAYRAEHGLPPFVFEPALRDIAARHSMSMAKYEFVDHQNPWEQEFRNPQTRGQAVFIDIQGENIASALAYVWPPQGLYYAEKRENSWQYYSPAGEPITIHSYLSLAQALVERWYQSPPHRRNLLDPRFRKLGCAVRLHPYRSTGSEMPVTYATQNFSR